MGEKAIFGEINSVLKNAGFDMRIKDMSELRNFLSDQNNEGKMVYDDIRELYDQIVMGVGMW